MNSNNFDSNPTVENAKDLLNEFRLLDEAAQEESNDELIALVQKLSDAGMLFNATTGEPFYHQPGAVVSTTAPELTEEEMDALIAEYFPKALTIDEYWTQWEETVEDGGQELNEWDLYKMAVEPERPSYYDSLEEIISEAPEVEMDPETFYNYEAAQDWARHVLENPSCAKCYEITGSYNCTEENYN